MLPSLDERNLLLSTAAGMYACGVLACLTLQFQSAPYGRYEQGASRLWGPRMNGRLAWFLQELPCVVLPLFNLSRVATRPPPAAAALLAMYLFHYANRALVYPLRIRGGRPTPFSVFLMALAFCVINGHLQSRWLLAFADHAGTSIASPRFAAGSALWAAGLAANWHADGVLRSLRAAAAPAADGSKAHYRIPRGGLFEFVSGANFLGEIVEWAGWALAAGDARLAGAFAFFTACNIGPRAVAHHEWYLEKFKGEYPSHRRALIPFLF